MAEEKHITDIQLENLGKRLRAVRKAKGYSNYEHFAYQNGLNRAQYGKYENGANISFKTLVKLVDAFDMTLEEFFSEGFEINADENNSG